MELIPVGHGGGNEELLHASDRGPLVPFVAERPDGDQLHAPCVVATQNVDDLFA